MHRVLFQQFLFKDKDGTDSSLFNVTLLMFKFLLYFRAQLSQHQEQAARVVVVQEARKKGFSRCCWKQMFELFHINLIAV